MKPFQIPVSTPVSPVLRLEAVQPPTKNCESAVISYASQVPQPPPYTAPSCSMVRAHVLRYVWPLLAFLALFRGRSPCDFASDAPQASRPQQVRKMTAEERRSWWTLMALRFGGTPKSSKSWMTNL